jgi:hypothetical protein
MTLEVGDERIKNVVVEDVRIKNLAVEDAPIRSVALGDARIRSVAIDDAPIGRVDLLDFFIAAGAIDSILGGVMIRTLKQSVTFEDFADDGFGQFVAAFTTPLPPGALAVGTLVEVVVPMTAPVQNLSVRSAPVGTPCANLGAVQLTVVGKYPSLAQEGGGYDATPPAFPQVDTGFDAPVDGEIAVTIYYIDPGMPELKKITETITFADFADIGGGPFAPFAGVIPGSAQPIGGLYNITVEFAGCDVIYVLDSQDVGGAKLAGSLASNVAGRFGEGPDNGPWQRTPDIHPYVFAQGGMPVAGEVTISLYYLDNAAVE